MKLKQPKPRGAKVVYAGFDAHAEHTVAHWADQDGTRLGDASVRTTPEELAALTRSLSKHGAPVHLTFEAGPQMRWIAALLRPLVARLIVCDPRRNRLVCADPHKCDAHDAQHLCELLRLGSLKEVWVGGDEHRRIYRELLYSLFLWRDRQREAKTLIKSHYRHWGIGGFTDKSVFSQRGRQKWLESIPGLTRQKIMVRLYVEHDFAGDQWKETLHHLDLHAGGYSEIEE